MKLIAHSVNRNIQEWREKCITCTHKHTYEWINLSWKTYLPTCFTIFGSNKTLFYFGISKPHDFIFPTNCAQNDSGMLNASFSTNNTAKIWEFTMCGSLTGLLCVHVLYHFILPTILFDKHFHSFYLKTKEKKYTKIKKKSPNILQVGFKLKVWHQKSANFI